MTWCILATGASMSLDLMQRVRHLPCIAVNNAWQDAPWARALVANDASWWRQYPQAAGFAGDRWCGNKAVLSARWMGPNGACGNGSNSGLRALDLAIRHYGATRVLLLGVDLVGRHYHADHPAPLKNPDEPRFAVFRAQFDAFSRTPLARGVEVLNCSPISTLECFPKCTLDEALEREIA